MPERAGHGTRVEFDNYPTTPQLARLIVRRVRELYFPTSSPRPGLIFEPGSGSGSFLEACAEEFPGIPCQGFEINPLLVNYARARGFAAEHRDVLKNHLPEADLIIGNPPFVLADDFVPACYSRLAPGGVLVFIERLNFLAGAGRFHKLHKTFRQVGLMPLPARPGFTRPVARCPTQTCRKAKVQYPDERHGTACDVCGKNVTLPEYGDTDATDYGVFIWAKRDVPFHFEHLDNTQTVNKWTAASFPDPTKTPEPYKGRVPVPSLELLP